jgi:hypothetical protein
VYPELKELQAKLVLRVFPEVLDRWDLLDLLVDLDLMGSLEHKELKELKELPDLLDSLVKSDPPDLQDLEVLQDLEEQRGRLVFPDLLE